MYNLIITSQDFDIIGIDAAMRVQFGDRISGLTHSGGNLHVHFFEPYTAQDETDAQAVVDAHDPVFITAEREGDIVTVSLSKPRNVDGATEITLSIDDTPLPESTPLTDNVATVLIQSADEITIGIVEDYPHQEVTI